MLPNLLIIGTPKSGTTTLKHALKQHSDIFFASETKMQEPHFLTYKTEVWPKWAVQTQKEYEDLFNGARRQSIRAEKSTWYLYSKHSAEFAKELLPEVKAIAILRNPVERAFSAFQFNRQHGWEVRDDFMRALIHEDILAETSRGPYKLYSRAGFYFEGLSRWQHSIRNENVKVLIFDDLKQDFRSELKNVFEFLNVSDKSASIADMPPQNVSVAVRSGRLVRLRKQLAWAKRVLPGFVCERIAESLDGLNAPNDQPKMSKEASRYLAQKHENDVALLSELLQRDLHDIWLKKYL